jgi:uncharacterized protein (DUF4415 family)
MASKPDPFLIDDENPEWTAEDFKQSRPGREVLPPTFFDGMKDLAKRRGRPPAEAPKVHIGFRLAPDVVAGIRATGRGYNARVEKVLRAALAKGRL